MFYHLFYPLKESWSSLNILRYITFRSASAAIFALLISFLIGPWIIHKLKHLQIGENIRSTGPKSHLKKKGTPTMGGVLPYKDFFHTALVIHVNLSVLVWTLSFAGVLWSLTATRGHHLANRIIFGLTCIATLLIVVSGFLPDNLPLMNNYVPVLQHPVFFMGLLLFCGAISAQIIANFDNPIPNLEGITAQGVIRFGLSCAAISTIITILSFIWSWWGLPDGLSGEFYYELLFWGGGHVLQYTYILLMMVCWLWLATIVKINIVMSERIVLLLFVIGLITVIIVPVIYFYYGVTHPQHKLMFTWHMIYGGSLSTFPLGIAIYYGLVVRRPQNDRENCAYSALITSIMLFGSGGVIGFMITGNDVTVPAHYHGCIVGVTLALMGVAYDLLPRLGFSLLNYRVARIQLWLYSSGQFLHIFGLVWSGGYGVQRKTAGAAQSLDSIERVLGMGLMGLGGLISAIGGLIFVVVVIRALCSTPDSSELNQQEPS